MKNLGPDCDKLHCPLVIQNLAEVLELTLFWAICHSQSHIATDGQSVNLSWCRSPYGAHDYILDSIWQLLSCPYEAPSLTRGRVCHLSESCFIVIKINFVVIISRFFPRSEHKKSISNQDTFTESMYGDDSLSLGTIAPYMPFCVKRGSTIRPCRW
jgi:hypothetical protein